MRCAVAAVQGMSACLSYFFYCRPKSVFHPPQRATEHSPWTILPRSYHSLLLQEPGAMKSLKILINYKTPPLMQTMHDPGLAVSAKRRPVWAL